jgi:hypothetical protein
VCSADLKEIFKMNFHKWKFISLGIIIATFFHGIYDFNLFLPYNTYNECFLFFILSFGLFIGSFMINEGVRLSKELMKKTITNI